MPNTALQHWACQQLALELEQTQCRLLAGDASFRKYYRLTLAQQSWVLMDSPPDKEKNQEFIQISQLLAGANIDAPRILAQDDAQGWMLLSDLGDKTLLTLLDEQTVDTYYQQALDVLSKLQMLSTENLPVYDTSLLNQEMDLFLSWFVEAMLGYSINSGERALQQDVQDFICQQVLQQPQAFVHRDYHSRNLMLLDTDGCEQVAVIDYQDAVKGPISYDLASLLRDCYIAWPQAKVEAWVGDFYQANPLAQQQSLAEFQQGFDLMGLQRHIKVLGIFARLALRDGKQGYLQDLPLVLQYTLTIAAKYPEFQPWLAWFKQSLLPKVLEQDWAKEISPELLAEWGVKA